MIELREYQKEIAKSGADILKKLGILCLNMEVRTGKTFTSLEICNLVGAKQVLFVTKKKAIESIRDDYNNLPNRFYIEVINYESVHKIDNDNFDCIICDEYHSLGAFPKPSGRAKKMKELFKKYNPKYHIMLSGTPSPESYSQLFHPFWINSDYSPFKEQSFYKWAHTYVDVKKRYVAHGNQVNDYSFAYIDLIKQKIDSYCLSFTQKQAGFTTKVNETILEVEMKDLTYKLIDQLKRDLVIIGSKGGEIIADTPVKLLQKVHQLSSGTCKLEDGSAITFDTSKVDYINKNFSDQKLCIFYLYKQEREMLIDNLKGVTESLEEFRNTEKHIILQIRSGREGISVKEADSIVFFNIDYSATSYWQARDRLTTKDRKENNIFWLFSLCGIEKEIYKKVIEKKSFTTKHFNFEGSQFSKYNNKGS